MTTPAPHKDLVNDALAVFDLLESQAAKALSPLQRREQLVALVTEVGRRDERPWSSQDILKAVDCHLARSPSATSKLSRPEFMVSGDSLWTRLKQGARRCVESVAAWWQEESASKFWLLGSLGSVVGALVLVFAPWTDIVRSPFVLAARHGTAYSVVLFTLIGWGVVGCIYGTRERSENLVVASIVSLVVLALLGGFGGGIAHVNATSTSDLESFQHGLSVVDSAVIRARQKLKPGSTLAEVVDETNSLVHADQTTRFENAGQFDPRRGVISRGVDLNPTECKGLRHGLPSRFHIVQVNGKPYKGGDLVCPFIWQNRVIVEGTLTVP